MSRDKHYTADEMMLMFKVGFILLQGPHAE
jgi:hypothetical protein